MGTSQRYEHAVPVDQLSEHPDNPRRGNVRAIADSIEANGFYGAVYAQRETGLIVAGNHRYRAAVESGHTTVPVIWLDVDDAQARRLVAVDNRTSDLGGYDDSALVELLSDLAEHDGGLDGTGYNDDDLTNLLDSMKAPDVEPLDEFPEYDETLETAYRCPKCTYEWSGAPK